MNLFGIEIFDSGIFLGGKIWQVFFGWFDLSRDFWGYFIYFGSAHVSCRLHSSTNIDCLQSAFSLKIRPVLISPSTIARQSYRL